MAKDKPNKLPFTLFLISLSLHLIVFAASSHEYVWSKPVKPGQPIKFRVVSVEKPEEKLPPNPRSRFLSNANRKESGAGKPGKTPRLRRGDRDLIPSRRGVVSPEIASLAPAPKPKVPPPAALPVSPKPPVVVTPKPELEREEKKQEKKAPETLETKETPKPIETANLETTPEPSVKIQSPDIREIVKPKEVDEEPGKEKTKPIALPPKKPASKPVVKKKPRKGDRKIEAKGGNTNKLEMAALPPAPKPKAQVPTVPPVSPKPPAVVMPKPKPKKVEKPQVRKAPETLETKETPKPREMARLAPAPKPSPKPSPPVHREIIKPKPKAKPKARTNPEKKKRAVKTLPKKKPEPKPVVKKKTVKKVVKKKVARKKPRRENRKVEAKKQTKEKVELAALKPVSRPVRPRRPAPKRPQSKDPLALFRVKPQPRGKPELPKFDLSDEAADRIAKKSISDKDLEKEEGETISLDTRDFRYASYFAHIKRRIQNAWIWPAEAQKNRGELLLRFKLRKNGTLEDVRLIKSAGVRILDDLAMAAVTKAAPFEPFPEGLERKAITATFVYD